MAERLTVRSRASAGRARGRRARAVTVLLASVALIVTGAVVAPSGALADQYPSWADVQRAKANQAATQGEVARVTAQLGALTSRSAAAQRAATLAGDKLATAQDALFAADQKYRALHAQAGALTAQSTVASTRAGRVAAQLYRSGGHNLTVSLLFASTTRSGTDPTALLDELGTMTKLTESTSDLWAEAQQAKNTADAAAAQAKSALDERTRLQQQAQMALTTAVQASAAAQQAVQDEQAHSDTLKAMLAALKDKTTKTVASYQKGVAVRAARAKAAAEARARALAAAASQPNAQGWARPLVSYFISSPFGPRPAPCSICSSYHLGIDLAAATGTPIHAAHAGTVEYAGWNGEYGNFVLIDDGDGISTAYGHIVPGGIAVSLGQHVTAGQVIAHVGATGDATGPHLHFEVRQNGVQINPAPWMAEHGVPL